MFGFSLQITENELQNINLNSVDEDINNCLCSNNYYCKNSMVKKFGHDKVFSENESFLIILDGVILNKIEIEQNDKRTNNWFDTITNLYIEHGETFFNLFRGSFSGVLYDKKKDKWIIFSDHIGTKYIYYTIEKGLFFCSSMIKSVYEFFQQNNLQYELNVENAYLLLSYGYMLEDRTLCNKIKKIQPGCYLVYEKGIVKEHRYYLLDNTPDIALSENDSIELIDEYFRKAISLQFKKDEEYGYKHLVALSAGLDSRMVCWVAHDMGFTNQLNFTFSQSNYLDETIPKKITADLKTEWIFKALDNGLWLYDIDEITEITGGNVLYYGLAHGNSLLKYLNLSSVGMIHSGQLGDVVISSFYNSMNENEQFILGDGAYSNKYLKRIRNIQLKNNYKNKEIANFYYRGFSGANNGLIIDLDYSETFSPFYNIDFLQKSLSIPLAFRYKHYIYKKWILNKYPLAAKYKWEKIGAKINEPILNIGNKRIPITQLSKKIFNKLGIIKSGLNSKNHMNPLNYYMKTNQELQKFIISYFNETIDLIRNETLRNDLLQIIKMGSAIEKTQAISLLSAVRMFKL